MQQVVLPTSEDILGQTYVFRPRWWAARVPVPEWCQWLDELADAGRGYRHISRADILSPPPAPQPVYLARQLVAGYVWGTGHMAFLVGRRARVFRENEPQAILDALQAAASLLTSQGPVTAYQSMLRGEENHLKGLGPSFFTKFLYAADSQAGQPGKALIMDRLVAIAMNRREDWGLAENGPWSSTEYERWLDYAHRLALSNGTEALVRADAVEYAVYRQGRMIYDERRAAAKARARTPQPSGGPPVTLNPSTNRSTAY